MPNPPANPRDWKTLHLWEIQPVRDVLILLLIMGLIYVGYVASIVTVPILLALALAYLFEPLVSWLTRRRIVSRNAAATGIILLAGAVVVVPAVLITTFAVVQGLHLAQSTASNIDLLVRSVDKPEDEALRSRITQEGRGWVRLRDFLVKEKLKGQEPSPPDSVDQSPSDSTTPPQSQTPEQRPPEDAKQKPASANPSTDEINAEEQVAAAPGDARSIVRGVLLWIRDHSRELGTQALATGANAFTAIASVFASIGVLIFTGALTAFFFFFFCTGWGSVLAFWESLIPERRKGRIIDLLHQMDRVIAGFVRGRVTICAILGVFATLAYWAVGVPAPLIFGPLVGALFIMPYIHFIVVPAAMIAMAVEPSGVGWQSAWWWTIAGPLVVYIACQMLDDYVLTPTIQGNNTGMDTPTIVFASFAGGALGGIYGLLIAIPVAACIKILLREVFWPKFKEWAEGRAADFLPIESRTERK
ncbi:MAG TPA: AI-2E family transporter [Phycisphaerales bacterium]